MSLPIKNIQIFTDGACSGNPGVGGWGAVLRYKQAEKEISGAEELTTNNRMEMTALIKALELLKEPCDITVYTDSRYLMNGVTQWLDGWVKNGWKTSAKKSVLNADLWQKLIDLMKPHHIRWEWIKGHNGHEENERVDALARTAVQKLKDSLAEK